MTVNVAPFTSGGVDMQVVPSKVAGLVAKTGIGPNEHPKGKGVRACPAFRNVTVWISSTSNRHWMLSPALIHSSLGRNASASRPRSLLSAPTVARHCGCACSGGDTTAAARSSTIPAIAGVRSAAGTRAESTYFITELLLAGGKRYR